uniref:NADH-ubiquinone oxidoreductase chain 2 n=2 Tax=Macropodus TaxID=158450 RepID=A0A1V1FNF3_9TELE|nr:NADH dehydrogenase subunit 2 [Macropodus ocellatus]YP_009355829.1 NADH dehydrogenase subunit 2 [Macropodus chinensis]AIK25520.1 NADH dehydrogenase subunit 2 [Macropodus ocellatus]BAX09203.1 NADH dehydrogenase subunit 2 [Macropodus chinensis]
MNPHILSIMLFGLGLGTTITFASSHWLLAWMGLEINTLAILPLMTQRHHPRAVEATTKYFLTQATAAATLLFASTTNAWITGEWNIQQMSNPFSSTLIILALSLKIGLAPMHAWMPEVLQGLDLTTGLVMATWQKLAPFALLLQIQPNNPTLPVIIGLFSVLIGGWGGLNQTQLRKILAYSSIAHLGWMMLILSFLPSLTLLTLLTYFLMTFSTFLVFKTNKATTINMLAISWTKTPVLTALTPLILLSLGGLPPLTGFMPKWLIIQELTKQELGLTATLAALSALLSLYFYLRLSYAMTLTMSPNILTGSAPWRLTSNFNTLPLAIATISTISLLPLMPAMVTLLQL